jgi:transcriptional regulator with XRE-family HTH domain
VTEVERFWRKVAHDPATPARLKMWRERKHFTQRALAQAAGCAVTTVNEVETGKRPPRVSTLKHILGALGIAPWMLEYEPNDPGLLAHNVYWAAIALHDAFDAYAQDGRTPTTFGSGAREGGDENPYAEALGMLEEVRWWIAEAVVAAGEHPAGAHADFAARLTGRQEELAQAWAAFDATVRDIVAEAQRQPRDVSHEFAAAVLGNTPIVC